MDVGACCESTLAATSMLTSGVTRTMGLCCVPLALAGIESKVKSDNLKSSKAKALHFVDGWQQLAAAAHAGPADADHAP